MIFFGNDLTLVISVASAIIIYHYFASKDALMDEVYREIKRNFGKILNDSFVQNQPLKGQIRQILGLMIHYYIKRPLESAFLEQYTRSPYYNSTIETEVSQYYVPLLTCFEQGQQDMVIKNFPPPVMLTLTLDVATSLAQKQAAGFFTLTDDLIEEIIDACWEAIRA